jgi:hypothetical protein
VRLTVEVISGRWEIRRLSMIRHASTGHGFTAGFWGLGLGAWGVGPGGPDSGMVTHRRSPAAHPARVSPGPGRLDGRADTCHCAHRTLSVRIIVRRLFASVVGMPSSARGGSCSLLAGGGTRASRGQYWPRVCESAYIARKCPGQTAISSRAAQRRTRLTCGCTSLACSPRRCKPRSRRCAPC